MTLADFLAYVLAPLGAGPILDAAIKPAAKARLSALLLRDLRRTAGQPLLVGQVLDRIFGQRLLSFRAVLVTVLVSAIAAAVGFIAAYLTTDPAELVMFDRAPTVLEVASFVILVLAVLVADVICFAQTRLFIRAAEAYHDRSILLILLLADVISSLFIFCAMAALAAAIACTVLPVTGSVNLIVAGEVDRPLVTARVAKILVAQGAAIPANVQNSTDFNAGVLARQHPALRQLLRSERRMVCRSSAIVEDGSLGDLLNNLQKRIDLRTMQSDVILGVLKRAMIEELRDKGCVEEVTSRLVIDKERWLSHISLSSIYLASLNIISTQVLSSTVGKFYGYIIIRPYRDFNGFAATTLQMQMLRMLGVGTDTKAVTAINGINFLPVDNPRQLSLPISPFMLSSLLSSVIFLLFCLLRLAIYVGHGVRHLLGRIRPNLAIEEAPFQVIGIGLSLIGAVVLSANLLLDHLWLLLFA